MVFQYLDKLEKEYWLPQLFHLLYENMKFIAPSGLSYDEERKLWLAAVSPALEKAPRQIILCFSNGELAGYAQYYTRGDMLMVEEVQLKKSYQRSFAFYRLCKHLLFILPPEIRYVEAYADKRNIHSQQSMSKLGMKVIEEDGPFLHLRGELRSATDALYLQ